MIMSASPDNELPELGSNADARRLTHGRHPDTRDALLWLAFRHLPEALQVYSKPFYVAACRIIQAIPMDSPELATALNGLVAAKDSAVRAGIKHQQGAAGSVPRPPVVADPPGRE